MISTNHRPWWPRATLRRDEDFDLERKVTWLELFFDLVFVVVLARLAHDLIHHPTGPGMAAFVLQFAAVFWAWNAFTYYIERFESGGLENRLFMLAAMAAVAAMAVWTEDGLGSHYVGFATTYVITRSINMTQWIRASRHVPAFAPTAHRFFFGFLVSVGLLVLAADLDEELRLFVFGMAVLIDIATPTTTLRLQAGLPQLSTSKFPERFGLFTIIVLGESVVGVINGVSERHAAGPLAVTELLQGGLGLLVGIGLWWIYFDFVARRPPRARIGVALGWAYLHLLTLAAFTATGAFITLALTDDGQGSHQWSPQQLLAASLGLSLLGLGSLETTLQRQPGEPTGAVVSPSLKVIPGLLLLVVPIVDYHWNLTALLLALVACLAVSGVYGAIVWYSPNNAHRGDDPHRFRAD